MVGDRLAGTDGKMDVSPGEAAGGDAGSARAARARLPPRERGKRRNALYEAANCLSNYEQTTGLLNFSVSLIVGIENFFYFNPRLKFANSIPLSESLEKTFCQKFNRYFFLSWSEKSVLKVMKGVCPYCCMCDWHVFLHFPDYRQPVQLFTRTHPRHCRNDHSPFPAFQGVAMECDWVAPKRKSCLSSCGQSDFFGRFGIFVSFGSGDIEATHFFTMIVTSKTCFCENDKFQF